MRRVLAVLALSAAWSAGANAADQQNPQGAEVYSKAAAWCVAAAPRGDRP
jgi:hypothetical protein